MNSSNVTGLSSETAVSAQVMNITLMCIGIATVFMNIFVIAIIASYKWMRSNANIIICSMAVTDLMAGLVTITAGVVKWTDWISVRGLFCEIFYTVDVWAAMASLAHVLAVNGERYLAIVFPFKYKQMTSRDRIRLLLLAIWILTLLGATANKFSVKLGDQCLMDTFTIPGMAFSVLVTGVAVPFMIVIVLYFQIVVVIVKKFRFMARSSNLDHSTLLRSQRKTFVVVSVLLAAWVVCWFPLMCVFLALTFTQTFNISLDAGQFVTMYYYVELMSYANSLLNPMLYFLTGPDFRKAAIQLFKCKANDETESNTVINETENTRL